MSKNFVDLMKNKDFAGFNAALTESLNDTAIARFDVFKEDIAQKLQEGHSDSHVDMVYDHIAGMQAYATDGTPTGGADEYAETGDESELTSEDISDEELEAALLDELATEGALMGDFLSALIEEEILSEEDLESIARDDVYDLAEAIIQNYTVKGIVDQTARAILAGRTDYPTVGDENATETAVAKKKGPGKVDGWSKSPFKEGTAPANGEELNELSKKTLGAYIRKAGNSMKNLESNKNRNDADHDKARQGFHHASSIASGNPEARKALHNAEDEINKAYHKRDDEISHKTWNRGHGTRRALDRLTKEGVEPVEELSKKTLGNYIKSASVDKSFHAHDIGMQNGEGQHGVPRDKDFDKAQRKHGKRSSGIQQAVDKLTKESVENLQELSAETLRSYAQKALRKGTMAARMSNGVRNSVHDKEFNRYSNKRQDGVSRAINKLAEK